MSTEVSKPDPKVNESGNDANDRSQKEELDQVIDELVRLKSKADRREIGDLYEIACKCRDIKKGGSNKYGKGAGKKAADRLGMTIGWFNQIAIVPDVWKTKTEIEELAARVNSRGLPLSWTPLVRLAHVEDPELRSQLLEAALSESLSVRALRARIAEATGKSKPKKETVAKSKPSTSEPASDDHSVQQSPAADEEGIEFRPDPLSTTERAEELFEKFTNYSFFEEREILEPEETQLLQFFRCIDPRKLSNDQYARLLETIESAEYSASVWSNRLRHLKKLRELAANGREVKDRLHVVRAA